MGVFGSGTSWVVVIVVAWVLLPTVACVAWLATLRHLRALRKLQHASTRAFEGRPGPAVVQGTVRFIDRDRSPVETVIEEAGELDPRGRIDWKESTRSARREPFEIVLADDGIVRVEPDDETVYADALVEARREQVAKEPTLFKREKRASLADGRRVWVAGAMRPSLDASRHVGSTYRGAVSESGEASRPRRLVLRGAELEPLWISTSPPGQDRLSRIALHSAVAVLFTMVALFVNVAELGAFYKLRASGHDVVGVVEKAQVEPLLTRVGFLTSKSNRCSFRVRYPDSAREPQTATIDVDDSDVTAFAKSRSSGLPLTVFLTVTDGARPAVAFTSRVGAPHAVAFVGCFGAIVTVLYLWAARRLRPWYERGQRSPNPAR